MSLKTSIWEHVIRRGDRTCPSAALIGNLGRHVTVKSRTVSQHVPGKDLFLSLRTHLWVLGLIYED